MNGQRITIPANDDDTVELVLTPEQVAELSLAAETAEREAAERDSRPAVAAPRTDVALVPPATLLTPLTPVIEAAQAAPKVRLSGLRRWHQTPLARMAVNTLGFVAFAWWSVAQFAGQPSQTHHPQVMPVAATHPAAAVPQAATQAPALPPMQVVNPFDPSETFEFPAGTSQDEVREKVAEILTQRAHERQSKWQHIHPQAGVRTASLAAHSGRQTVQGSVVLF